MNVFEAISKRRSVRAYSPAPIPDDVLQRVLNAMRCAPSACNLQPWRFIIVRDESLRRQIAQASHNQTFVGDAPVVVVAVGFPAQAFPAMAGRWDSAAVDVAIAVDHLTLAAAAEGLGTCWIGAFDEEAIQRLLRIPNDGKVIALTPLGRPKTPSLLHAIAAHSRKPWSAVFAADYFDAPDHEPPERR